MADQPSAKDLVARAFPVYAAATFRAVEGSPLNELLPQLIDAALRLTSQGMNDDTVVELLLQSFANDVAQAVQTTVRPELATGADDAGANQVRQIYESLGFSPEEVDEILRIQFGLDGGADAGGAGFTEDQRERQTVVDERNAGVNALRQQADSLFQLAQESNFEGNLDLANRQFDEAVRINQQAEQLARAGLTLDTRRVAGQEVGLGIEAFGAESADIARRGGLEAQAGLNLGSLASTVGTLGAEQARLGLEVLQSPRNLFPAFFLGLGQDPSNELFEMFDLSNLLGVDVSQIQGLIDEARAASQAALTRASQPGSFDLTSILGGLDDLANKILGGLPGFGKEQAAPILPPEEAKAPAGLGQRPPGETADTSIAAADPGVLAGLGAGAGAAGPAGATASPTSVLDALVDEVLGELQGFEQFEGLELEEFDAGVLEALGAPQQVISRGQQPFGLADLFFDEGAFFESDEFFEND